MHYCFDFKTSNLKPSAEYQYCRLHFVYDTKSDLRYKARLVCNGNKVDLKVILTRETVATTVSVHLLDQIPSAQSLKILCGDIGNAFIQATINEMIFSRVGSEFGNR